MTTTLELELRPITDFPSYAISPTAQVWSVPRTRPGKGGSTRHLRARKLKPDHKRRVTLSDGWRRERFNIDFLWRRHFPEYRKFATHCRAGHALVGPGVGVWGTGNRVCLVCHPAWTPPAPSTPTIHDRGRAASFDEFDDGYFITTAASAAAVEIAFPRVSLVPEHLAWLEALMRQRP